MYVCYFCKKVNSGIRNQKLKKKYIYIYGVSRNKMQKWRGWEWKQDFSEDTFSVSFDFFELFTY